MGKTATFLLWGLIALQSVSCSAVGKYLPYTLNDRYRSASLSERKMLVVFPDEKNIIINNKDDIADDFGGVNATPESRIRKFYFPEIFSTIKSLASGDSVFMLQLYKPALSWDSLGRNEVTLRTGSDSTGVPYIVPEKSRMVETDLDSVLLIIFEEIEFTRNKFKIEYYWDDRSRKQANLEAKVKIVVWDYLDDSPVFYGSLSEQVEFQFGLQRKHWDESARRLAKKIVMSARCL